MRPLIVGDTPGYVYLLCWRDTPLGNLANPRAQASHYLGWTNDLPSRLNEHAAGRGQHITAAAVERGITWEIFYRPGTPAIERALKRLKMTPCLCPNCARSRGRRPHHGFQPLAQLALPLPGLAGAGDLDIDVEPWPTGFEFPTPALTRPSWAEWANDRQQRALRVCAQTLADDWDEGLL